MKTKYKYQEGAISAKRAEVLFSSLQGVPKNNVNSFSAGFDLIVLLGSESPTTYVGVSEWKKERSSVE